MKKVNFKKMRFWSGIAHTQKLEQDVRLALANLIYRYGEIRVMDVALRIYHYNGDIELSDDDFTYLQSFVSGHCSPQW